MKDWLASAAYDKPRAPALVTEGSTLDYAALDREADLVAGALAGAGIGAGDRVALWAENSPQTVAAVWGIPRAGAIAVFLGMRLPPSEAERMAASAGVGAVWGPGPDIGLPGIETLAGAAPTGYGGPPLASARFVVFTSGSEGASRPVVLTGANVAAAAAGSQSRLGNGAADRWLCVLPLHHVGGLSILWRSARESGAVVLERSFDEDRMAALLSSGEVTLASLVPVMLSRVLRVHGGPYRGLSAVLVGGGTVDPGLLQRAREAGIPALQTYGMTETASQVATGIPGDTGPRSLTAGWPLQGFEIRLTALDGTEVLPGSAGRIEVRGPALSPGYLDGPTRRPGEWLRTGDLGVLDSDGYLTVLGRADEVVVSGGENIHPAEVAAVLRMHPSVADAEVRGQPDPEWGQIVVAEVVGQSGQAPDLGELERFARARLAGFKVPKRWVVVPAIDRSEMGKRPRKR